ncbi:hypothetical protein OS493_032348, partial [Desmophyllum pertusum]
RSQQLGGSSFSTEPQTEKKCRSDTKCTNNIVTTNPPGNRQEIESSLHQHRQALPSRSPGAPGTPGGSWN